MQNKRNIEALHSILMKSEKVSINIDSNITLMIFKYICDNYDTYSHLKLITVNGELSFSSLDGIKDTNYQIKIKTYSEISYSNS
jgi:hypothetical protein